MTRMMTIDQFREDAAGTFWTIRFRKRNPKTKKPDGAIRTMQGRFGVTKHLMGGTLKYDPRAKNLLCCYDAAGNPDDRENSTVGYKMINLDGLIDLHFRGSYWEWNNTTKLFVEIKA